MRWLILQKIIKDTCTTGWDTGCRDGESAGREKPSGWAFRTTPGSWDPTCARCSVGCNGCRACCVADWRSRQSRNSPTTTEPTHQSPCQLNSTLTACWTDNILLYCYTTASNNNDEDDDDPTQKHILIYLLSTWFTACLSLLCSTVFCRLL